MVFLQVDTSSNSWLDSIPYEVVTDNTRVAEVVEELSKQKVIGVDTENTGLDEHTDKPLLLQIGTSRAVYIFHTYDPLLDIEPVKRLLEDPNIVKVFFNAKYDYRWLFAKFGIRTRNLFCCQVGERLLNAGKPGASALPKLTEVLYKYLAIKMSKEVRSSFINRDPISDPFTEEEYKYSIGDTAVLPDIYYQEAFQAERDELLEVFELEMDVLPSVAEAESHGCLIDQERWRDTLEVAKSRQKSLEKEIFSLFEGTVAQKNLFGLPLFNIASPPQLKKNLARLGFELEDTNESVLSSYKDAHPVFPLLMRHRSYTKIISAYGEKLLSKINKSTGRLHANLNQVRALTGRMSSCFPAGTEVTTLNGVKPIESINKGEYVWTRRGFRRVEHQWESGTKDIWEIRLSTGEVIKCSGNHPFLTPDGWVRAEDLSPDSVVYKCLKYPSTQVPYVDVGSYHENNYYQRNEYKKHTVLDERLATLLGYAVGDGHLRPGRTTKSMGQRWDKLILAVGEDEDLVGFFEDLCEDLFGVKCGYRFGTCHQVELNSTKVCMFLKNFGVDKKSVEASVPSDIFTSPLTVSRSFLRGLFEADGGVYGTDVNLFSSSTELLRGVQVLLSRLGIVSQIKPRKNVGGFKTKNERYALRVVGRRSVLNFKHLVGFLSERKSRALSSVSDSTEKDSRDLIHFPKSVCRRTIHSVIMGEGHNSFLDRPTAQSFLVGGRGEQNYFNYSKTVKVVEELKSLKISNEVGVHLEDIIDTGLFEVAVSSVRNTRAREVVYDLSVEGDEFLVAGVVVHNSKPNLQQIPGYDPDDPDSLDFRSCFVAAKGRKLITADFSQQELRILADMSEDPTFYKAYTELDEDGNTLDVHKYTASVIFEVPYKEVTDQQRKKAKVLNFFLVYGGGAYSLAETLGCTKDEAQAIIDGYFKRYAKIKLFLDKSANDALNKGFITTISNRRRYVPLPYQDDPRFEKEKEKVRREGKNTRIQGSGADVTKKAMAFLYNALVEGGYDATIMMVVHDEFVVDVCEEQAEEVAKIVEREMIRGFTHFFKKIPMTVDAHIGDTWEK